MDHYNFLNFTLVFLKRKEIVLLCPKKPSHITEDYASMCLFLPITQDYAINKEISLVFFLPIHLNQEKKKSKLETRVLIIMCLKAEIIIG